MVFSVFCQKISLLRNSSFLRSISMQLFRICSITVIVMFDSKWCVVLLFKKWSESLHLCPEMHANAKNAKTPKFWKPLQKLQILSKLQQILLKLKNIQIRICPSPATKPAKTVKIAKICSFCNFRSFSRRPWTNSNLNISGKSLQFLQFWQFLQFLQFL